MSTVEHSNPVAYLSQHEVDYYSARALVCRIHGNSRSGMEQSAVLFSDVADQCGKPTAIDKQIKSKLRTDISWLQNGVLAVGACKPWHSVDECGGGG